MADAAIRFRALESADLTRMHWWLNRDHVARWWPGWPTPEQVRERYTPQIERTEPSYGYIIEVDTLAVGFIQFYLIRDWPDYAKYVAEQEDAAGVDLFIGEPDHAHRGMGPRILRAFLREVVFPRTGAVSCIIGPAVNNRSAIRAYEKAGFKYLKTISIPGELEPEYLMRIGREEFELASAVLLAGGRSARMGMAKAALKFGDTTMLERIAAQLGREFAEIVVVAAPADVDPIATGIDARIIHDEVAYGGPVGALARGLRAAAHDVVFACSCDLPMLNAVVAKKLCAMLPGFDAIIPKIGDKLQPLHAAYAKNPAIDALDKMTAENEQRLTEIPRFMNARIVVESELRKLDPELASFINVNTPDDYRRALAMLGMA
jgi:molybdopterin-guanine dinucleotide biosynthesis protein A/RimJ/RimL family protein N-acetyltransferase